MALRSNRSAALWIMKATAKLLRTAAATRAESIKEFMTLRPSKKINNRLFLVFL